ncbi:MAG: TrpB-like pyridoxal phosphate-dependent enzyme [Candidatus Bipolaricaulaceae bacterium]
MDEPLPPPLDPKTKEPVDPKALLAPFSRECIAQEVSTDRFIDIPEKVREVYRLWLPTPPFRALNLKRRLQTPARIHYKYEGTSPHRLSQTQHRRGPGLLPQARGHSKAHRGDRRRTKWGSAFSFACQVFGLQSLVCIVRISYEQKPYRRGIMEIHGAEVVPSPSPRTAAGRKVLAEDPHSTGSLGIAISKAVETAFREPGTKYSLGSVLTHGLLRQTIVGEEALLQMEMAGDYPDVVVGRVGGGYNFVGLMLPFLRDAKGRGRPVEFVVVDPVACPSIHQRRDRVGPRRHRRIDPLLRMHTLGPRFIPPPIHAGGLRYPGMAPIVTRLVEKGLVCAIALDQVDVFEGAVLFAQTEGIGPCWAGGGRHRSGMHKNWGGESHPNRAFRPWPLRDVRVSGVPGGPSPPSYAHLAHPTLAPKNPLGRGSG